MSNPIRLWPEDPLYGKVPIPPKSMLPVLPPPLLPVSVGEALLPDPDRLLFEALIVKKPPPVVTVQIESLERVDSKTALRGEKR